MIVHSSDTPVETKANVKYIDFIKDVMKLSISCFGGPHAHLVHYQKLLVEKKRYLSKETLTELYALCQIIPGPTSTQTLTSVGYKLGGPNLAYLTLFTWMLPSVIMMTAMGLLVIHFQVRDLSIGTMRFIQPMAIGFVGFAAYSISTTTVKSKVSIFVVVASAVATYLVNNPFVFPITLGMGGAITALDYRRHAKEEKKSFQIPWSNFFLWAGVLILAAVTGVITQSLPIRLFENFYRNGSIIYGGGATLAPLLYTEFVEYAPKQYLTSPEFLSGYAVAQAVPGPVFSFSSYIGALSMRHTGVGGEILGGLVCMIGITLPGTFLTFFVIRIWDYLKRLRPIRASLEGINAATTGLIIASTLLLIQHIETTPTNIAVIICTFCLLAFTKIPAWGITGFGLLLGIVIF